MAIALRPAEERGITNFGWLDSRHTFSFGDYYNAQQMGFGVLRVINEDRVQPGGGFATHGHLDMEIISCVLEGALEHKDSLGTGSVIRPGDVQRILELLRAHTRREPVRPGTLNQQLANAPSSLLRRGVARSRLGCAAVAIARRQVVEELPALELP
jgi:hypothetical protein